MVGDQLSQPKESPAQGRGEAHEHSEFSARVLLHWWPARAITKWNILSPLETELKMATTLRMKAGLLGSSISTQTIFSATRELRSKRL
jgi:hypothetical protein